jgi:SAM-dependent methyltransferase
VSVDRNIGINVPGEAYPYLQMQRGAISDFAADSADTWLLAYTNSLFSEFDSIEPYLPKVCETILDVGSGLGGIDALLNQHYGGDCEICLLDGVDDHPMVESHAKTFNDMQVARRFLSANGVHRFSFIDAGNPMPPNFFFDLVVSFRSWCFHLEPKLYLDFVRRYSIAGATKLIVDVRRGKPEWLEDLKMGFRHVDTIYQGAKFSTLLLEAR